MCRACGRWERSDEGVDVRACHDDKRCGSAVPGRSGANRAVALRVSQRPLVGRDVPSLRAGAAPVSGARTGHGCDESAAQGRSGASSRIGVVSGPIGRCRGWASAHYPVRSGRRCVTMSVSPLLAFDLARQHQRDLAAEAERYRLVAQAKRYRRERRPGGARRRLVARAVQPPTPRESAAADGRGVVAAPAAGRGPDWPGEVVAAFCRVLSMFRLGAHREVGGSDWK